MFLNRRRINGHFDSFKAKLYRFTHRSLVAVTVLSAGALLFFFGRLYASNNVSVAFAATGGIDPDVFAAKVDGLKA